MIGISFVVPCWVFQGTAGQEQIVGPKQYFLFVGLESR